MPLEIFDLGVLANKAKGFFISNKENVDVLNGDKDAPLDGLSTRDIKGILRGELNRVLTATPKAKIFVEWLSNVGWITNGEIINTFKDINAVNKRSKEEMINVMMCDPKVDKHLPSGEHNNNLENKEIWGVRINVF